MKTNNDLVMHEITNQIKWSLSVSINEWKGQIVLLGTQVTLENSLPIDWGKENTEQIREVCETILKHLASNKESHGIVCNYK